MRALLVYLVIERSTVRGKRKHRKLERARKRERNGNLLKSGRFSNLPAACVVFHHMRYSPFYIQLRTFYLYTCIRIAYLCFLSRALAAGQRFRRIPAH